MHYISRKFYFIEIPTHIAGSFKNATESSLFNKMTEPRVLNGVHESTVKFYIVHNQHRQYRNKKNSAE
jgi:tRNA(Glu) U13 pseudouridine synthase TruD